jgi:hypothetical protein
MQKNLDDYHLIVKNFEITESRFTFYGQSRKGHCYLRISVKDGTPVFLCVQLKNYTGTSITNAAENIFLTSINMLVEKNIVTSNRKKSFKDFFSEDHFEAKKKEDRLRFFSEKSVWIEHYPPETGLAPGGSFALVKFDSSLHPSWSYVRKETAIRASALENSFFDIPYEKL